MTTTYTLREADINSQEEFARITMKYNNTFTEILGGSIRTNSQDYFKHMADNMRSYKQ